MIEGRTRDLAMFNLTIDSKLRGRDAVAIKVEDIAPDGSRSTAVFWTRMSLHFWIRRSWAAPATKETLAKLVALDSDRLPGSPRTAEGDLSRPALWISSTRFR
jgi:hypothetical protein